jgi:hypothetical protein
LHERRTATLLVASTVTQLQDGRVDGVFLY